MKRQRSDKGQSAKFAASEVPTKNAARERSRVKSLGNAFKRLQEKLPGVPQGTKLAKLEILILAMHYIRRLDGVLKDADKNGNSNGVYQEMRPVKKWPMRLRMYSAGTEVSIRDRHLSDQPSSTIGVNTVVNESSDQLTCYVETSQSEEWTTGRGFTGKKVDSNNDYSAETNVFDSSTIDFDYLVNQLFSETIDPTRTSNPFDV